MSKKTTVTSTVAAANLPTEFHFAYTWIGDGVARVEEVSTVGDTTWVTFTVPGGEKKVRMLPADAPITFVAYVEDWPGEPDRYEV